MHLHRRKGAKMADLNEKKTEEMHENRITTPYDRLSPDEIVNVTRDLIRARTMNFKAEPNDRRQPGGDAIIKYMESLIYHIREHKWRVAADCAKRIATAAEFIDRMEEEIFENTED